MTEVQRRVNVGVFPNALFFITTCFWIVIWNTKLTCLPSRIIIRCCNAGLLGLLEALLILTHLSLILQSDGSRAPHFVL